MDYSEIWRYNLKSNFSEKLVEMQSSGVNFQISFDGNTIYFRNKATSGKRSSSMYSILKHSIPDKKNELIFSSKERISTPILVYDWLYFIQDGKPKSFNLITNQIGSEFKTPFYYVDDNYLIKYTVKPDTIMLENGSYKFINCNYTTDLGFITILTASQGIVVLDIEGNLINTFRGAKSIDKLSYSNLVVYTEEEDDGKQITSSELFIGFLNSNKKLKIDNPENELRFNPRWSNNKNMITYTNGQGQIKTITLNVDVK